MELSPDASAPDLGAVTAAIWERGREETMRRVATIERAVAALLGGGLDGQLRAQAQAEAHKLAGSLGMVGFPEGTRLARRLEQALDARRRLSTVEGQPLAATVLLLRCELDGSAAPEPPASVEAAAPARMPVADEGSPRVSEWARSEQTRLLAVDDDPLVLEALRTMLGTRDIELSTIQEPDAFWQALEDDAPHLVLLDLEMPRTSGIELCRALRAEERFAQLPVIFLTARRDAEAVQSIFQAGADDYVTKPIVGAELITRIQNRLERVGLMRELADRDPLTGVLNRRSSSEAIERYMRLSDRYGQPLSLALLDIDHFKQVNDRHGHLLGDAVLRTLGELMIETFRSEDVVARWGGEEFVIAMYGMRRDDGVRRITEMLDRFSKTTIHDSGGQVDGVTYSAGVAAYGPDGDDLDSLYRSADHALLRAKAGGRRQVLPASPDAVRVAGPLD